VTEEPVQEHPEETGAAPPAPDRAIPESPRPSRPVEASRRTVSWLAAFLVLVIAGVVLSPFWAPAVAPLFPWGGKPVAPAEDYAALAARLEAIEKRPAPPIPDVGAITSAQSALARRVDQLETARNADRENEAAVVATKTGLQKLEQRLGAIEAQSASRAAAEAAEIQKVQEELTRFGTATTDIADRLPTLERQVHAQSGGERSEAALLVVLLQMREAVEQARPFAAEFTAFTALAHDHPDLVAAAEPLAEAARNDVPGRAALSTRLAELAGHIATATAPPPETDWRTEALARLRALVTIRRINGAAQDAPEAAVSAAELALGRGDLGNAVAALDRLSGANAEAAAPWLQIARQRLAVEAALAHLQELLVARLGTPPEAPGSAPAEAPAKPRTPS